MVIMITLQMILVKFQFAIYCMQVVMLTTLESNLIFQK